MIQLGQTGPRGVLRVKPNVGQRVQTKLQTTARVDPRVVLASQILQLTQHELEQIVQTELMENPALERIDDFEEPLTTDEIMRTVAPVQLKPSGENHEMMRSLPQDAGDDTDWVDLTASDDTLWDHLHAQLSITLPDHLRNLAAYLIGSVNDRGYLSCSVEDAALDCQMSLEDAERVLAALQACEPAGVGATDLRECLLLQLRDASSDAERLAKVMLRRYWDELVARNAKAIMRATKADGDLVDEAFEVILSLNPFPGEAFCSHIAKKAERTVSAQPDVVITLDEIGWLVEVPGDSTLNLRINPSYDKSKQKLEEDSRAPADEKRHIFEFWDRANRFLDALTQRRQQLAKIAKYLVEKQGGFVKTGEYRFLQPLTRTQMAKDLGLHESTVSRATNGKFIQIATKDVVSFDLFFKPSLRIQKMIEELLETENPDSPMSDERIAQILEERGVKVARRTVNKYRDRNRLLSSRLRKSA